MFASAMVEQLARDIMERAAKKPAGQRFLAGIAGIPAAGKSTLAALVSEQINQFAGGKRAVTVPMDGFHKKNSVLLRDGNYDSKGKPETFDVDAFLAFLRRVKRFDRGICGPVYSRQQHDVIEDAYEIGDEDVAVIEGNYLFLNGGAWAAIGNLLDLKIFLAADRETALARLYARQLERTHSAEEARRHVMAVDLPNIMLVEETSSSADMVVQAE
jgi:pantothenate kinase